MLRPPLALVMPSPDIVPPAKVVSPLTFNVPLPPRIPLFMVRVVVLASGLDVLKKAVFPSTKVRPTTS